jgi:hypothetical protein
MINVGSIESADGVRKTSKARSVTDKVKGGVVKANEPLRALSGE